MDSEKVAGLIGWKYRYPVYAAIVFGIQELETSNQR
jgi:hypothetical protein